MSIERPNSELETGLFLLFSFLPLRSPKVSRYSLFGTIPKFTIGFLRQSSPCRIDVKFVPVIGLGLNFDVIL